MKSANHPQTALEVSRQQNDELVAAQSAAIQSAKPQAFDIEAMFRFALEKSAGPEAMTTLMNIRRELNAEASKKAFDEALSAFQAECPVIVKSKAVPLKTGGTAYKYAPIEQVEEAIRPIERKHGFTHTFDTDVTSVIGFVIAKCIVTHNAGHTRESVIKLPLGIQTQIMSPTQTYAGALTFANRRALANVYGLVIAGEDIDGADKKPRPQGPAQQPKPQPERVLDTKALQKQLWDILKPVVSQNANWNKSNWDGHNAWLRGAKIIPENAFVVQLSPEALLECIDKAQIILNEM